MHKLQWRSHCTVLSDDKRRFLHAGSRPELQIKSSYCHIKSQNPPRIFSCRREGEKHGVFSPRGKKPMGSVEYLGHRFSINHPKPCQILRLLRSQIRGLLQELNKLEHFESMPQWCLTTAPIVCTNFPWQFESAKVAKWVDSMPRTVERLPLKKTGWETASLF